MLRFDVGEDLLHYCCNVDRVTVYATAPVNVAVGARILRQIAAGAGDGGQEPRAGSIELAEAGYRAAIGGTVAVPCTRHAVDTGYSGVLTKSNGLILMGSWCLSPLPSCAGFGRLHEDMR